MKAYIDVRFVAGEYGGVEFPPAPSRLLQAMIKPLDKKTPSFRLPRFRGERSEESLLEGLHVCDHVFNLVVVNHVLERQHQ